MGSKRKYKNSEKYEDTNTGTKTYWEILCLFVFIAFGLTISAIVMPNWRIAEPIDYTYVYRDKKQTRRFGEVLYGLYKLNFDGGSLIETWNKRVETCKSSMLSIPEGGSGSGGMIQAKLCPTECESGIKTRCNAYKRIQMISTVLLVVLAVSGLFAIAGIALYFCLKAHPLIYLSLWGIAGVLSLGTGGYWIWETNDAFWLISNTQQVPYPSVGFCWYMFVGSSATYLFAAFVAYFLNNFDQSVKMKLIKDSLYTSSTTMYPQMSFDPYATPNMNTKMGLYSQMGAPPPQNLYLGSNTSSMPVMMGQRVPPSRNPRIPMMPYMMPDNPYLPQTMQNKSPPPYIMTGKAPMFHMMPVVPPLPNMMPAKRAMPQARSGHAPNFNL